MTKKHIPLLCIATRHPLLAFLCILALGTALGWGLHDLHSNGWSTRLAAASPYHPVKFLRVVDGDTIEVLWRGERSSVRMLRINTPERGQRGYIEATEHLASLIGNANAVMLEFEEDVERDRYGRLLCYVWLDGKNLCVEQVRAGYSRFWTKYGDGKYSKEFVEAEKGSRR